VKAYRDYGKSKGIKFPEMFIFLFFKTPNSICANTVHAAFQKGCDYFGIEYIELPVDQKTFQLDPKLVEKKISSSTV
jgi:sphinganine-1-phosphate aldolase